MVDLNKITQKQIGIIGLAIALIAIAVTILLSNPSITFSNNTIANNTNSPACIAENCAQNVTYNLQPTPRVLDEQTKEYLEKNLPQNKSIRVFVQAVMEDQEAFNLAEQITNYLIISGRNAGGIGSFMTSGPPDVGIEIIPPEVYGQYLVRVGLAPT